MYIYRARDISEYKDFNTVKKKPSISDWMDSIENERLIHIREDGCGERANNKQRTTNEKDCNGFSGQDWATESVSNWTTKPADTNSDCTLTHLAFGLLIVVHRTKRNTHCVGRWRPVVYSFDKKTLYFIIPLEFTNKTAIYFCSVLQKL